MFVTGSPGALISFAALVLASRRRPGMFSESQRGTGKPTMNRVGAAAAYAEMRRYCAAD